MDMQKLSLIPLWMIPFIFSLSFHEFAHAWMANRLGDNTAKFMGRLSMNPKVHIDPIGTIVFPILGFITGFPLIGWAKPVIINERNFKSAHRDAMYVAAAGPISNLFLSLCFTAVASLINQGHSNAMKVHGFDQPLLMMAIFGIQLNVFLAFFNLIPIPPLDGGRVLRGLFPGMSSALASLERYGFIVVLFLLYTGLIRVILEPASRFINVLMSLI
jgi:Zn-dependent protease